MASISGFLLTEAPPPVFDKEHKTTQTTTYCIKCSTKNRVTNSTYTKKTKTTIQFNSVTEKLKNIICILEKIINDSAASFFL